MAPRLSHYEYYIKMLDLVSARSTCVRRRVGAIITTKDNQILSTGYNGVPTGFSHCIDVPCAGASDPPGDTRRCYAVHAEVNAIIQCKRLDLAHTMYITCEPCFECAKMIANTPIKIVWCTTGYPGDGAKVLEHAEIDLRRYQTGV